MPKSLIEKAGRPSRTGFQPVCLGLPARGTACLAWGWKPRNRQARGAVLLSRQALRRNHADGSGWHGQLGRSRRQLAAELRHRQRTHPKLPSRRTQSGGRVARHNRPVACSTQTSTASFRLGAGTPLQAGPVGQASSLSILGFQPVAPPVWRGAGSPGTDRPEALSYFPDRLCAGTMQMDPGGTANLAVLGGNLPPSFGTGSAPTQSCLPGAPRAAGASPATTGQWPVPPRPLLHRSGWERARRAPFPAIPVGDHRPAGCSARSCRHAACIDMNASCSGAMSPIAAHTKLWTSSSARASWPSAAVATKKRSSVG